MCSRKIGSMFAVFDADENVELKCFKNKLCSMQCTDIFSLLSFQVMCNGEIVCIIFIHLYCIYMLVYVCISHSVPIAVFFFCRDMFQQ